MSANNKQKFIIYNKFIENGINKVVISKFGKHAFEKIQSMLEEYDDDFDNNYMGKQEEFKEWKRNEKI